MNPPDTYKVTGHMDYGIAKIYPWKRYFRWYWQANAWSWLMHHVMGYSCNTWKKNENT